MRGGAAKASVFFLVALVPASTHALPTHQLSSNAAVQHDSILLRQGVDGVYAQFQASCATCSLDGENTWPVDFFIGGANGPCDNVSVSVNGQELSQHWEGQFTSGSGSLPSSPSNGSVELQATWQSICVTAPLGAPHKQNAHVFSVMLDNDCSHGLEEQIGFTISFGGYEDIEVLRVSNFPVDLSVDSEWGEFIHPEDDTRSNTDSQQLDSGLVSLDMKLEAELQKLQVLHYELRQLHHSVTLQKKKIRHLLKKDCAPLLEKWGQCEDFFCYLKSSWQKVPEFYWSIRYRFGLLGSGKIIPICRAVPEQPSNHNTDPDPSPALPSSHPTPTHLADVLPTDSENTSFPSPTSNTSDQPFTTSSPLPPTITPSSQETDPNINTNHKQSNPSIDAVLLPIHSATKHFLRSCAILLLIVLVCWLVLRIVRRSTAFRRRRRDIASRREEFRTRRAYRNAARRLRWRQWWEGWTDFRPPSDTSEHSLAEFQHARGADGDEGINNRRSSRDNDDSDSEDFYSLSDDDDEEEEDERQERRMMQAEILGLRRVLEYVGDLVGVDGTAAAARRRARSRSRSGPPPYERRNGGTRNSSARRGNNNDPSITPATPAISGGFGSPRASTMFSLETGSLVTLETIDTLDSGSAPPSYHP